MNLNRVLALQEDLFIIKFNIGRGLPERWGRIKNQSGLKKIDQDRQREPDRDHNKKGGLQDA